MSWLKEVEEIRRRRDLAQEQRSELGISLGPSHWEVINFAREDFAATGKSPGLRRIATNTSVVMKDLYKLFPKGPAKKAARCAGLGKPEGCI